MVDAERDIYIRPTTGLPAEQPVQRVSPLGSLTLSEEVQQELKEIREFIHPSKPEIFPPEEW